ncbi:MAG: hypothetical protein JWN30_738 [Bacilli bacterium]|nr:hypothetical protein [Bacilli bacterium]
MYFWQYNPPYYYTAIPQYQGQTSEFEWNRRDSTGIDKVHQLLENHLAVSNEILSIVRQNNEMLRMLTVSSEEPFFQHPALYPKQS